MKLQYNTGNTSFLPVQAVPVACGCFKPQNRKDWDGSVEGCHAVHKCYCHSILFTVISRNSIQTNEVTKKRQYFSCDSLRCFCKHLNVLDFSPLPFLLGRLFGLLERQQLLKSFRENKILFKESKDRVLKISENRSKFSRNLSNL